MDFSQKLGVSKKIGSFSIPLGATINMDGCCVCYIIRAMFIAKVYEPDDYLKRCTGRRLFYVLF